MIIPYLQGLNQNAIDLVKLNKMIVNPEKL